MTSRTAARASHSIWFPLSVACMAAGFALPVAAQQRAHVPRGGTNWVPQTALVPGLVTQDLATGGQTPASLVQALVGVGVTVTNIQYNGAPIAAGTFTGGTGIIGFAQGIVLSSGDVGSVAGPSNVLGSTSTDNLFPGDVDLDALVTGATQDATVLEFDFSCPTTSVFSFQYVFASEEYDEWVNTQYNDVFAFFLNGQNIALIPGTSTPVAINNVNCDNPYNPPAGQNCALYTTNDCDSMGFGYPCTHIATEMDGLTSVFSAVGTLNPGPNHIKLAIADRGDGVYDSNVFIRGESFVCSNPGPAFDPPSPCGQTFTVNPGAAVNFEVHTLATNGLPGEAVTLSVSGSAAAINGGTFNPPLPAGPAPSVHTEYHWTPGPADVGSHDLQFDSTDQIGQSSTCDVTIEVVDSGVNFCAGDGSSIACPCHNNGADGHGCVNSLYDSGALLTATGTVRVSNDTARLTAERMTGAVAVFFQGATTTPPTIIDDGLGCVGGPIVRLGTKISVGGSASFPAAGDPLISVRGGIPPSGGTYAYQCFYRNAVAAFCPPATSNRSNGVLITWAP